MEFGKQERTGMKKEVTKIACLPNAEIEEREKNETKKRPKGTL